MTLSKLYDHRTLLFIAHIEYINIFNYYFKICLKRRYLMGIFMSLHEKDRKNG